MAFADDFSYSRSTGNLRHVSGTTRYEVINSHRYLMSLTASATGSGDDDFDITELFVPSKRNSDTDIEFNGNVNIDAATAQFLFGGSITQASGAERWSGLAIAGSFPAAPQVVQSNAFLTEYWGATYSADAALGYAIRILVRSRTGGSDIDGGRVRVQSREFGYQYREGATVLGRNESVAAVGSIALDSFNQTAIGTIAGYTDVTNTEGYQLLDLNNGNGPKPYYSRWNKGSRNPQDVYERIKWATRNGTAETLYGLDAGLYRGVTHVIQYDNEANGPFVEASATPLTFGNGATAQLLGLNDQGATGTLYVQLLTGLAPADNDTITQGAVTADVNGTPVTKAIGVESVAGNFTGAWLGAYGVGFVPGDLVAADSLIALDDSSQSPLDNQTFSVAGLVVGEDRVILGRNNGSGGLLKAEYAAAVGNNSGNGTIGVKTSISNAPPAGFVRISNGSADDLYTYTSFSGSTFTLSGTLSANYAEDANVYVTFIDKVAASSTETNVMPYTSDISLVGLVTDAGGSPIVPAPLVGTFGSGGFSATVNRVPDA